MSGRFARQEALFGSAGQALIRTTDVAVVGVSGVGSPVVQELALLGVPRLRVFDSEELDETNRNRLVGAKARDPVPGMRKVDIAERLAQEIDETIIVRKHHGSVVSESALDLLRGATHVFGCVDTDGPRFYLAHVCSMFAIPYIDLASDTEATGGMVRYGGRCFVNWNGAGCLVCAGEVDPNTAAIELATPAARNDRDRLYGIERKHLATTGPSVASVNAVVASLGVTEFMAGVTGLRAPKRHLVYRGDQAKVTQNQDPATPGCLVCAMRGQPDPALLRTFFS